MLGVLIITNAGGIFRELTPDEALKAQQDYPYFVFGVFAALIGSLGSGIGWLAIRKLGEDVHQSICPFYYGLFGAIFCSIMSLSFPENQQELQPMTLKLFVMLVASGFFGWYA